MGVSLRIDNDDIPWHEKIVAQRERYEIDRLQSMHGIIGYENGNGYNGGREKILYKKSFDLIG